MLDERPLDLSRYPYTVNRPQSKSIERHIWKNQSKPQSMHRLEARLKKQSENQSKDDLLISRSKIDHDQKEMAQLTELDVYTMHRETVENEAGVTNESGNEAKNEVEIAGGKIKAKKVSKTNNSGRILSQLNNSQFEIKDLIS